jgi:predicted nucleic acid-binding protein
MLIADTDVLVDALRGAEPVRSRVEQALTSGALATTAITAFELTVGARSETQSRAVDGLLGALSILPLDAAASCRAAEAHRELADRGRAIGTCDTLIAGICLAHGAELLTRNREHFERIAGLRIAAPST